VLMEEVASLSERITLTTHDIHQHLDVAKGFGVDKVTVVPDGLDVASFPREPTDLAGRRQARAGKLVVGFLARACPEKGLEILLRALAILARDRDIEVIAAGAIVDAERLYLARCLELVRELGLADRFTWRGQVDRDAKLALLREIDLFALPTTHPEAKGLSAIEAMAAGVPVVASNHGAFPEMLDDERAGLLHAPGDAASLAGAIAMMADDPERMAACGRHAHSLARSRHSAEAMAQAHEALYDRLAASGEERR